MPDQLHPGDSVRARYDALAAEGRLDPDPAQEALASRFDALNEEIGSLRLASKSSSLGWLFAKRAPKVGTVKGLYVHGHVGRGKTMLMDFFFAACPAKRKRRVHFHDFMADAHDRIAAHRKALKEGKVKENDPIAPVARDIASESRVICFDEFAVNDIADAMILSRLFTALFENGVILVATSNVAPDDLYRDGLNRSLFLPFIDLVLERLDVLPLNGPTDYRLDRLGSIAAWHTPLGDAATAQVREAFFRLTDYKPEDAEHVPSCDLDLGGGRTLHVPKALKGVAVFSFKRLCGENRGASDYLAIAREFHSVIVVGIPQMGPEMRNEAIRFTKLVDALYELRVKLFVTADAEPEALYVSGDGAFEFDRTVSRLKEMQSADYMALGHGED